MHWQHQNPLRARDHRISLMPLADDFDQRKGTIRGILAVLVIALIAPFAAAVIGG